MSTINDDIISEFADIEKEVANHMQDLTNEIDTVQLSEVQPTKYDWLWDGYFVRGAMTLFAGQPGTGKSTLFADIISRITTGNEMPDGSPGIKGGGNVLILCSEDSPENTIAPRIAAAGGDLKRVFVLQAMPEYDGEGSTSRPVELPRDIGYIRALIEKHDIQFFLIDPLGSFFSGSAKKAAPAVAALAEDTNTCVVAIQHLTKSGSKGQSALMRGKGGVEIAGTARMAYGLAVDPKNLSEVVLVSTKSNITEAPKSLRYTIETNEEYEVGVVAWRGESDITSHDLEDLPSPKEAKELVRAMAYIQSILAAAPNGMMKTRTVEEIAKEKYAIAKRTLDRARAELNVQARQRDKQWYIYLPKDK